MVGLVASKVKEKYYRPVIAFAESSETELKGSGRSIPGCTCAMRWNCSTPATPA